jgi:2-oxoglutarate dehydrogenase complex dehydrogenase (E1) component-like enzyme
VFVRDHVMHLRHACSGWQVRGTQALLLHGDAAMAGLGIVPETMQLSKLPGYRIGGSVHVVINNHIGFTTVPAEGRSAMHATDCAKAAGIPVIHAFADCPESVVKARALRCLRIHGEV